jgi:Fe-S cluster assembly iron-binding protein IscA
MMVVFAFLVIVVRTKGCSGNAYAMDWVQSKGKLDEEVAIPGTGRDLLSYG